MKRGMENVFKTKLQRVGPSLADLMPKLQDKLSKKRVQFFERAPL